MHQNADDLQQLHALVNQLLQVENVLLFGLDVPHCVLDLHRPFEKLLLQQLLLLLAPCDLGVELKLQIQLRLHRLDQLLFDEVVLRAVLLFGLFQFIHLCFEIVPIFCVLPLLLFELLDVLIRIRTDISLVLRDELPHLGRTFICTFDHFHVSVKSPIYLHVAVYVVTEDLTAQQALISVHHFLFIWIIICDPCGLKLGLSECIGKVRIQRKEYWGDEGRKIIIMQHKRSIKQTGVVEYTKDTQIVDDATFYKTLRHYSPLFTVQQGTPMFLFNKEGPSTHLLMLIINLLAILESISLWSALQDSLNTTITTKLLFFANLFSLIVTDICYLLTITLNPGIRNLSSIDDQQYQKKGKQYCIYCQNYKTYKMYHCVFCQACIQDFDHHCNILNRCVGGPQKKYFCIFILFLGISFFSLLVCGIYSAITL